MKPSDEIFLLIKSMTGKEKLFFRKKYLSLIEDADKNYLKLFDEISKQSEKGIEYDEEKIKKGNYAGKFIKNFSFHKNYLYNLILDSLLFFHKDSKDIYTARNLTTHLEILADKLLTSQSLKILQKAQKMTDDSEMFINRYELINIERGIKKYKFSVEEYTSIVNELFEKQYEILEIQKNQLDYYKLNERVGIFLRSFGTGRTRDPDELIEFEKIFDNELLKDIKNAKSFLPKYIFFNLNLQYHLTKENFNEAYLFAKSAVELCENNMSKLKGKHDNYIFALSNLLNCEIRARKYKEFDETSEKLKKYSISQSGMLSESNKVYIFYALSVLRLSKNMESRDHEMLKKLETEISREIKFFEENITLYQRIILYYFLSASQFMRRDFERCIFWNGKIFNLGKTDLSEDYQCYARIIQLISYYELGYIDSMEYALKSSYHFISKKKKVYKYENLIQKYLRKSFRIRNESELKEMFMEMKYEFEKLYKDPFEKNAYDAFNILLWLETKS